MQRPVAVIGMGSMGSMALWQLSRRGVPAVGFDQFPLGHMNGAFSGETRMFRTAYSNGPQWVPALRQAKELWRVLEAESGQALLDLNGFISIGARATGRIAGLIDCATAAGVEIELLDSVEARARFPTIGVEPGEVAVLDKAGGLIKPERAVMAALDQARALGAELRPSCAVTGVEPDGGGVTVETSRGHFRFGTVILATGAWSQRFLPPGLVTPHRVGLHWYLSRTPDLFTPDLFPPHIRYVGAHAVCLFSSQDRTMVKAAIGGSLGRLDAPMDARAADPWEEAPLSKAVARYYPGLWPHPVRSESYADGFTADGDGVIGPLPWAPRVLVAAGFSAHGFKIAPVVGAALADMSIYGKTDMPIEHLRLSRFDGLERGTLGERP